MEGHNKYLAGRLFTEGQMVTYRTLSRALKVHVNLAKAMLYEFHQSQNSMSDGKVYATYIVNGTKKPATQPDGDVEMASSAPDPERWGEEVPTQTVTLVTEERLKDVLDEYLSVTSFQVYSLAAHPVKDLQLLSDVSREAYQQVDVDHTEQSKVFGTISNHNMKKRTRHGKRSAPAPVPAPVEKKPALVKTASTAPSSAEPAKVKEEPKPAVKKEGVAATETPASSAFSSKKTAAAPKKGGIMSAFSKAASKPKAKPGSNVSTPKTENQSPALSDDGEDDEDPMPAPKQAADGTARRSRQDREAELRRMMEEESEEEEEPSEKEQEDEPMEEAPEPEPETKTEPEASQEPAEVVSSAPGSGRRRGRRQVMKKKQVMDDQGYLVTIQEKGWESFSEDEPAPVSSKPKSTPTSSAGSQGAKKKAAPKGQGNIMSFFSKK